MSRLSTESKSFRRSLLQLIITKGQSITAFIDPARARAHSESPTIYEEESPSPLSPVYPPSLLSPMSPRVWSPRNLHSPLHHVCQSCSPRHIAIFGDPEREEREVHPLFPSSVRRSRSLPILKVPTPPQAPAPAPAPVANPDPVAVVVQDAGQGVRDVETGTGTYTAMTSGGGMLDVPLVGKPDNLVRHYPNDYDLFTRRLHLMVRRRNSIVAARRRDQVRRRRQAATTPAATTPPSSQETSTPIPTLITPTAKDSDTSSRITETV
jgi:hypothetical protein